MIGSHKIKFTLLIFLLIARLALFGQVYSNGDDAREKHFIYEVKEIDEFFERFNDDPSSFIRAAFKSYHAKFNISRQKLIKSLFNHEGRTWDSAVVSQFISEMTNKKSPVFLDFYGDDWYAELDCKFKYNSDFIIIPLVMKIEATHTKGSKWMIAAVGPNIIKSNIQVTEMAPSKIKTRCISPTSHATNFVSLKRAFADKENLSNYFKASYFKRPNMMEFYNAILNNEIEFLYVIKIKYHFLVANDWIFTVEDFPREALNSGWLINSMEKVSSGDLENYRNKLLNGN
ncbi:MAG TPA: hypothetical protein VFV08_10145 [Puia sp.]|nr:hypothetical protein [Puia sp.]